MARISVLGYLQMGNFSWLPDGWRIHRDYLDESLVTNVELQNDALDIRIVANDAVDFHENLYLKKLVVENLSDKEREIKLFFAHDFRIYGNAIGDTAAFRPETNGLLHYKGERYFLVGIYAKEKFGIEEYAIGNKETGVFEGTWRDAEDGVLSGNPIAQGSVDSVLAIPLKIRGKSKESCFYWICCGKNWEEVKTLNDAVKKKGPDLFLTRTLQLLEIMGQ